MPVRKPDWTQTGGSASFAEARHELNGCFSFPHGCTAVPLGITQPGHKWGASYNVEYHSAHGLTLGGTRFGKGVSCIIPALLCYCGSMVVIDPKGENAWITAKQRRALGQRTVILDGWNEVNRKYAGGVTVEQTTRYNPLAFLDPASRSFADDVAAISDALIITTPGDNPHFPDSAREFVSGCVALAKELYGDAASLRRVRRYLSAPVEALRAEVRKAYLKDRDSLAALKLGRFLGDTDEIESVRSTAITQTAFLDSPDLLDAMEGDSNPFSLDEIAEGRVTVYLVLPIDKLETHGRWLRLMLTLIIKTIARRAVPPKYPVMMLLDEMGTVGPLRMVEQAYGLMAGVGIRLWGFLQGLEQLQRDYPKSWQTFLNNTSFLQVLRVADNGTGDYISKLLGPTTLYDWARSPWCHEMPVWKAVGSRPAMYANELSRILAHDPKNLENNTQLIVYPGQGNVLVLQNPYHKEARWGAKYRLPPVWEKAPVPANENHPAKSEPGVISLLGKVSWAALKWAAAADKRFTDRVGNYVASQSRTNARNILNWTREKRYRPAPHALQGPPQAPPPFNSSHARVVMPRTSSNDNNRQEKVMDQERRSAILRDLADKEKIIADLRTNLRNGGTRK